MAGDFDAISGGIEHALACADRVIDLAGGDILALPAEGVADAVHEMEEALVIEPHQIPGAKPGVAFHEGVAQDFLLGLGLVGIALEAAAPFVRGADAPDGFARLVARADDAETIVAAQRGAIIRIDLD